MHRIATAVLVVFAAACSDQSPISTDTAGQPRLSASKAISPSANPFDIAVIGDTPYGGAAIGLFPTLVNAINGDAKVREIVHVGDFKAGDELCSDSRFRTSLDLYNTFKDPFIYAIGDNEWTDCNRANNGGYNPLERLSEVRRLFYPVAGKTLGGRNMTVEAQAGYPENQLWAESRVTFAVLHIIGSNNGLDVWFKDRKVNGALVPETPAEGAARAAEVAARQTANLAWLEHAFATAEAEGSLGIVLFFQADLWHPEDRAGGKKFFAHQAWVERFAQLASAFKGKVLLVSGDSHDYRVDQGAPWLFTAYGVTAPANVTQVIVDRTIESPASDAGTPSVIEWLRLHVDPRSPELFSWEQVIVQ
ncbi:MAG: hypothetical protein V4503_09495 [Gemmatimonadota bacterium]